MAEPEYILHFDEENNQTISKAIFSDRFYAITLDIIFLAIALFSLHTLNFMFVRLLAIDLAIVILPLFYKVGMEYYYGATFGKRLMKISIVNAEGRRITLGQSLKRFSVYYLTIISGIIAFVGVYMNDSIMMATPNPTMGISIDWLEMLEERLYPLDLLFIFSLITLINSPNGQGLHDRFAKTHCIKHNKQ